MLVDDASDWPVPDDILAMSKINALRLNKREGLIRARTIGVCSIYVSMHACVRVCSSKEKNNQRSNIVLLRSERLLLHCVWMCVPQAQAAKGEVLTYLDSHCEVNEM